jgi:hypothetical protein
MALDSPIQIPQEPIFIDKLSNLNFTIKHYDIN